MSWQNPGLAGIPKDELRYRETEAVFQYQNTATWPPQAWVAIHLSDDRMTRDDAIVWVNACQWAVSGPNAIAMTSKT